MMHGCGSSYMVFPPINNTWQNCTYVLHKQQFCAYKCFTNKSYYSGILFRNIGAIFEIIKMFQIKRCVQYYINTTNNGHQRLLLQSNGTVLGATESSTETEALIRPHNNDHFGVVVIMAWATASSHEQLAEINLTHAHPPYSPSCL